MLVLSKLKKYIINDISECDSGTVISINKIEVGYVIRPLLPHSIYLYLGYKKYSLFKQNNCLFLSIRKIYRKNRIHVSSYYQKRDGRWFKD
jgi:hypothetical protein